MTGAAPESLVGVSSAESARRLPAAWRRVPLGEACSINPRRPSDLSRPAEALTTFVPLSAVDERLGIIARPELRRFEDLQRGYTYFQTGDVLFAKITPCMQNGKHAVARDLIDGIGLASTEFHVVRSGAEIIPEWIHYFIRQPSTLAAAERAFTGTAGQQRVPPQFMEQLEIPLPPVHEQKRIVVVLHEQMSEAERARAAAEAQLDAANLLSTACLRAAFDGPEAKSWPVRALGEISHIVSGLALGRRLPNGLARKIPYITVANVKGGYLDLSEVRLMEATQIEIDKCTLKIGDIILTEGGDPDKLGRGTVWGGELPECIHQNHIFRVRFAYDGPLSTFVAAQIGSSYGKRYFFSHAKRTTGIATINRRVLSHFPLLLPSRERQRQITDDFRSATEKYAAIAASLQGQLAAINALPAALLRCAFRGEL